MGIKSAREIARPEKIIPIQIPEAPRSSAYRGKIGAIIPTPSIAEKVEMARIGKTFFINVGSFYQEGESRKGAILV